MKDELSKSGLGEEEILAKTKAVMKAFGKEDAGGNPEQRAPQRVHCSLPPPRFQPT